MRVVPLLLLLSLTTSCAGLQAPWKDGRILKTDKVRVGLRPAMSCGQVSCDGVGLTLQVSVDILPPYPTYTPSRGDEHARPAH
jgi:hypothetical protein